MIRYSLLRHYSLIFFVMVVSITCKKNATQPTMYQGTPCIKVNGYRNLPASTKQWLDSIDKYNGKYVLVKSNNGLSESIKIEYDGSNYGVAQINCNIYSLERHQFNLVSSLYGNNFNVTKKYNYYSLTGDTTTKFEVSNACMEFTCDRKYYRLFSDSNNTKYTLYNNSGIYEIFAWYKLGKRKIGNKTYEEVYSVNDMNSDKYISLLIDKHFGIVQFTTLDSTQWTIQYE